MINPEIFATLDAETKVKLVDLQEEQKKLQDEYAKVPQDSDRAAEICDRDGAITWEMRELQGLNEIPND